MLCCGECRVLLRRWQMRTHCGGNIVADSNVSMWQRTQNVLPIKTQMHCSNSTFRLVIMLVITQLLIIIVIFSRTGLKTESGPCNWVVIIAPSFR